MNKIFLVRNNYFSNLLQTLEIANVDIIVHDIDQHFMFYNSALRGYNLRTK